MKMFHFVKSVGRREATEEISQPQGGWIARIVKECPEETQEGEFPASLQDASISSLIPATAWLANIQESLRDKVFIL